MNQTDFCVYGKKNIKTDAKLIHYEYVKTVKGMMKKSMKNRN